MYEKYEVVVVDGDGEKPKGWVRMRCVRMLHGLVGRLVLKGTAADRLVVKWVVEWVNEERVLEVRWVVEIVEVERVKSGEGLQSRQWHED